MRPKGFSSEKREILEIAINNLEEEIHAGMETAAAPYIEALRAGDLAFTETINFAGFARFLAMQSLRGPAFAEPLRKTFADAIIGPLRHIFSNNIGWSLFRHRERIHIAMLEAPPSTGFITSDRPVINMLHSPGVTTDQMQLYYPVSPKRALLVTADPPRAGRDTILLPESMVAEYNQRIEKSSYNQLYASSESYLDGRFKT